MTILAFGQTIVFYEVNHNTDKLFKERGSVTIRIFSGLVLHLNLMTVSQHQLIKIDSDVFNKHKKSETRHNLNLIPCKINHDGPAKVDTFMVEEETGEPLVTQTTFRGRLLKGKMLELPNEYQISIVSEDNRKSSNFRILISADGESDSYWKCDAKVCGMRVYSHDDAPDEFNSSVMNITKITKICSIMHEHV